MIQDIKVTEFPLVIFTDSHTNIVNIERLRALYPYAQRICLGDITFLWAKKHELENHKSIEYFIDHRIPCLIGNHETIIRTEFPLLDEHKQFLDSLPIGFKIILPNGNEYLAYHNRPHDLWCMNDDPKETVLNNFPVTEKTIGICQGHLHKSFKKQFGKIEFCSIGRLCVEGEYAILDERGIEFKKLTL